jgi:hypothetical protein
MVEERNLFPRQAVTGPSDPRGNGIPCSSEKGLAKSTCRVENRVLLTVYRGMYSERKSLFREGVIHGCFKKIQGLAA